MYCGDVSTQVNPRNMYNFINIAHKILLYMCPKLNIPVFINWEKKIHVDIYKKQKWKRCNQPPPRACLFLKGETRY